MKPNGMKATIALAFLVVALSAAPARAKDKWINLATKNFNIVSNADEGATRKLALKLEQFQSVFSSIFNLRAAQFAPVTVLVFKNDDSFKPFKPLYNGKPANVAGYFHPGQDENMIALNISSNTNEQRPMAVIFHEYTHLLTSVTPHDWPLWLKEGLAEVYSSFDTKENEVTLGAPIANHVYLLRESKFIPLQTLFNVRHGSPEYNERNKQGIFYAESWALVHYLLYGSNGARRPQLIELVKLINAGMDVERAFAQAFKTDYATIEKELRRYIGSDTYPTQFYKLKSAQGDQEMSVKPISEAEALSYLGTLLMRTKRMEEAEGLFKQAMAEDPALARPHEGLGFIAMRRDNYAEATGHFKQAAARDSKNFLVHYYYAETLQRQAAGAIGAETAKEMVERLKQSITLNPRFAYAYNLLAHVLLRTGGDLKQAEDVVKAAIANAPQEKNFVLTLAHIQARREDYESAKKTLEPLLTGDVEPGIKASAASMQAMIEQQISYKASRSQARTEPASGEPPVEPASESAESAPKKQPPRLVGRPTLQIEGAKVVRGVLGLIECSRGKWTLVVQVGNEQMRFAVSDKQKLEFYSQVADSEGAVNCGPVGKVAFIYFKPVEGQSKVAGDAVAVEFTR